MYVRNVRITDFRGIAKLEWQLGASVPSAGWHVVIGDNGAGKSSVRSRSRW